MMDTLTSADLLRQQNKKITESLNRPKAISMPKAVGISYNAKLQRIVNEIRKDVNRYVMPVVRQQAPNYVTDSVAVNDGWFDLVGSALDSTLRKWTGPEFKILADALASEFIFDSSRANAKRYNRSFGVNIFNESQDISDYIEASSYDNAQLITSIPEQYLTGVQSIVLTNIRSGGRPSAIQKLLSDKYKTTSSRAKMIARDQTAKVNANLSAKRQQAVGFEYFKWLTSEDSRVRDRHDDIADKVTAYGKGIYRWDAPPLSDKGVPITPGTDFQCRCVALPVSQKQVDENVKSGNVNKSVKR